MNNLFYFFIIFPFPPPVASTENILTQSFMLSGSKLACLTILHALDQVKFLFAGQASRRNSTWVYCGLVYKC